MLSHSMWKSYTNVISQSWCVTLMHVPKPYSTIVTNSWGSVVISTQLQIDGGCGVFRLSSSVALYVGGWVQGSSPNDVLFTSLIRPHNY